MPSLPTKPKPTDNNPNKSARPKIIQSYTDHALPVQINTPLPEPPSAKTTHLQTPHNKLPNRPVSQEKPAPLPSPTKPPADNDSTKSDIRSRIALLTQNTNSHVMGGRTPLAGGNGYMDEMMKKQRERKRLEAGEITSPTSTTKPQSNSAAANHWSHQTCAFLLLYLIR